MRSAILLIVIYLAFISLGLPDGVFGVAWPGIRGNFKLPLHTAGFVLNCSYMLFSDFEFH